MTCLLAALALCLQAQAPAPPQPSPPPDTEIYLAALTEIDGKVTLGPPSNVSDSPGYDNQPSFTADGQGILFTSVRGGRKPDPKNSAASGSDIYRYDIKARRIEQVTDTAESEYSPTVTPDGRHVSVIRVEADGTQRLRSSRCQGNRPNWS
jgi:Tol biopolymer transport system component